MKFQAIFIGFFMFCGIAGNCFASSNFTARGYYYKAKQSYEDGDYATAITYAKKSKDEIQGTNEELEYLLIVSLAKAGEWMEANEELNIYAALESRSPEISRVNFDSSVEVLTNDEKNALAKMMVDIMDHAEYESKEPQREKVLQELVDMLKKYAIAEYTVELKYSPDDPVSHITEYDLETHSDSFGYRCHILEYRGFYADYEEPVQYGNFEVYTSFEEIYSVSIEDAEKSSLHYGGLYTLIDYSLAWEATTKTKKMLRLTTYYDGVEIYIRGGDRTYEEMSGIDYIDETKKEKHIDLPIKSEYAADTSWLEEFEAKLSEYWALK